MEIKTAGGRKEAVNANEETNEKANG